jgi:YVTN family beta-propeller protein
MKRPPQATSARRASLALFVVFAATVFGLIASSANFDADDRALFGARPITPAGALVTDATTRQPAVGALPVNFVRSPDHTGADGRGRYLIAVNSGTGVQFNAATNRAQQSLAVIDLNARPAPVVVQNIYFPTPQSVNVGAVFSPRADADGSFTLYASGGFENKIWMFRLRLGASVPLTPTSNGPDTKVEAPFIDVSAFTRVAPHPRYNRERAAVYPTGLAISDDGDTLFVANNLGDSLGIIGDLDGARRLERIDLVGRNANANANSSAGANADNSKAATDDGAERFVYPYSVVALPTSRGGVDSSRGFASKVYVSCWNDASVAVVDFASQPRRVSYIAVERHPTAMTLSADASRLYVANSNADSVSVIDTANDREIERINVRLAEKALVGASPEGLALSDDGRTLYVANAHSNSVAVVGLSASSRGASSRAEGERKETDREGARRSANESRRSVDESNKSVVRGFIPSGYYPSAVAVVGGTIFVGNGKGTGFENSSLVANTTGREPNLPNDRFPAGTGRGGGQGGEHSVPLTAGNISALGEPEERALARYTQQVMRNDGLLGPERRQLFGGASPIKHIIYVIKENRTYDQVFGDLERSGDGTRTDGDAALAIFGANDAARSPSGAQQNVTPNHRALAQRFGLFDRFFVNSEASPDGHNWSTAAFSSDYLDKAYRWNYSDRGRSYDFEGFNRLPNLWPQTGAPPAFRSNASAAEISDYMRRFVPYLHGARDAGEPETLYLWDAVARAGLTYRNYGEFISTLSEADVSSFKSNRTKPYPDLSVTVSAFPTKKTLEGHHSATYRNFDMLTPDAMTVESYKAAKSSNGQADALVGGADAGAGVHSRIGIWLAEFRGFVAARERGNGDTLPSFSIVRLPNDHTNGVSAGRPTPQFYVAENDYALGRLVEAVSNSAYWKDTAIFVVEDDAQDGPDHVDCHRSVALVISAYNRAGALVHEFHSTVSLIRTMELLLGFGPLNQLDAAATPIDIFRGEPDLRPYKTILPDIALDNLMTPNARDAATVYWMRRTAEQDISHADVADPRVLNEAIWFSVRGASQPMPEAARLPAFDAMRLGIKAEAEREGDERRAARDVEGGAGKDESRIDRDEVARRASRSRNRRRW